MSSFHNSALPFVNHFLPDLLKEVYWEIPILIDKSGADDLVIGLSDFFKHQRGSFPCSVLCITEEQTTVSSCFLFFKKFSARGKVIPIYCMQFFPTEVSGS